VDDVDLVPSASLDLPSLPRISVSVPGLYDVAVRSGIRIACVPDVAVERGAVVPVTLRLPATEDATFRLEGDGPRSAVVAISPREVPTGEVAAEDEGWEYPGRGGHLFVGDSWEWGSTLEPLTVPLPRGAAHRYSVAPLAAEDGAAPVRLQPMAGVVRGGETIRLSSAGPAFLKIHFRTEPDLPPDTVFDLEGEVIQGECTFPFDTSTMTNGPGDVIEVQAEGMPGPAVVRWRARPAGQGHPAVSFPPGSLEGVVFLAGSEILREVTIPIDTVEALRFAAARGPLRVDLRLPDGRPAHGAEATLLAIEWREGAVQGFGRHTDFAGEEILLPAEAREESTHLLAVLGTDLVSEVVPLGETEGVNLRLRPAGLLLVAPDALLPEGAGRLTLRRADGGLVLRIADGVLEDAEVELPVGAGTLLGPFPEGPVTFEVRVGGLRLPDATAVVKAGRIEPLRVRTGGE
jgi:hypothetical protein